LQMALEGPFTEHHRFQMQVLMDLLEFTEGHSLEVQVSSGKRIDSHKPWLFGVDMFAVQDVHASGFSLK